MNRKIVKRNKKKVDYERGKIERVVDLSLGETSETIDSSAYSDMIDSIESQIVNDVSVEEVQDMVQRALMKFGLFKTAEAYILKRHERNEERKTETYGILSKEFISKYKHIKPPMTQLGDFVYYRTYSRFLEDKKRREYWWETVKRAVEYNCSLVSTTKHEAEELFDNIFHLRQFLSGRTFWVGNTEVAKHYPMANYNCFSRETKFLTKDGIKSFYDFADGEKTHVLDKNGKWSEATVNNHGEQNLVELTLRKGQKIKKQLLTTEDHLWFIRKSKSEKKYIKKKTCELKKGDVVRSKSRYEHSRLNTCPIGIQHGIIWGDGTFDKKKNHCKVSLIKDKRELAKYMDGFPTSTEGKRDSVLVYGLPKTFKSLPDKMNSEYIKGFIIGLISTDGSVSTSVTISNSNKEHLLRIQSMCETIGLPTYDIRENTRQNNLGNYNDKYYTLTIQKEYIEDDMLLRSKHKNDFVKPIYENNWIVYSVEKTNKIQDVWCVTEPKTNTFTLDNGILTHNCSFQVIDEIESFRDIFYLLMIGSGAGIRIRKSDVNKLPPIRKDFELINKDYSALPSDEREDNTALEFFYNHTAKITVGDSKEGWVQSLDMFMKLVSSNEYRNIKTIIIDYDHVRPKGEKLKTFGGTASGHKALLSMFKGIAKIIHSMHSNQLKPIDCLDISNLIGEGVVVGGVRRTAEIILMDSDDEECIQAKSDLYKQINGDWVIDKDIIHRQMSNNSIYYLEKPTRERLHWQIEKMRYSGEPAWVNAEEGNKRRPNFNGVNPCGEILLDNKGLCNLTTVNVFSFVNSDGTLDEEGLMKAQKLSARAGYRMTCVRLELPKWDAVQQRDKLIGCSLTGWQDMVNATKMTRAEQALLLQELRDVAKKEAERYALEIGQNVPLLVTTVKPEGTLSQLPTVSSGVHYSHSPYYIRRVRINADDPLALLAENLGYPIFPEVGQDWDTCMTKVVEFPVKAPDGITKYDVSAIEQLENYLMFQENYTDHNTSITVHVRNHEWEEVEQFVWDNWDEVMAVSFLSLDDSFYELLPYEAIDEEEYLRRLYEVDGKFITPTKISKYEKEEKIIDIGNDGCESGVCPVR